MAVAAAITRKSSRLFSLLSKSYSQGDCESFLALLSVVLFSLHLRIHGRVPGTCQARAFYRTSSYRLHTWDRFVPIRFRGS